MILQMNLYCQKCIKTSLCFCIIIVSWEICIRSVRSVFHYDTTTVLIEFMNSFHIVSGSSFSHIHLDPVSYQLLVQLSAHTTQSWAKQRASGSDVDQLVMLYYFTSLSNQLSHEAENNKDELNIICYWESMVVTVYRNIRQRGLKSPVETKYYVLSFPSLVSDPALFLHLMLVAFNRIWHIIKQ